MRGVEVSIDERYYEVEGVTPWDLNRDLRANGPRDDEAQRSWYGSTDFALRYRYEAMPWADGCRAASARVEVELVTTLPVWPDREAAPKRLREDWDLFLSRLREHERGHQRIAMVMGEELLLGVEALRATDCETLRTEARRLAMAFESAADLEHASWDMETAHGLIAAGGG
jgi:predicted secreted Zn-dependent protease